MSPTQLTIGSVAEVSEPTESDDDELYELWLDEQREFELAGGPCPGEKSAERAGQPKPRETRARGSGWIALLRHLARFGYPPV